MKNYPFSLFIVCALHSYRNDLGLYLEQTVETHDKGTSNEQFILNGRYSFYGADGILYIVDFKQGHNGSTIFVDRVPIKRIPPGALKSLVG